MTTKHPLHPQRILSRDQYLQVVAAGLAARQNSFARQAILRWLATYPGDLHAGLYYARVLVNEGRLAQSLPVLQGLCLADPEFIAAVELLLEVVEHLQKYPVAESPRGGLLPKDNILPRNRLAHLGELENSTRAQWFALVGQSPERKTFASWGGPLWFARQALQKGDLSLADTLLREVLEHEPLHPLAAVTHLQWLAAQSSDALEIKLETAQQYQKAWPNCLACMLYLAQWRMQGGLTNQAVALIHQVAARDVGGQVVQRLWGARHSFRSLWPARLELALDAPIPGSVTSRLSWNRLEAGEAIPRQLDEQCRGRAQRSAEAVVIETQPSMPASEPSQPLPERAPVATQAESSPGVSQEIVQELVRLAESASVIPSPVLQDPPRVGHAKRRAKNQPISGEARAVKDELEALAARLNLSGLTRQDGRYPIYVIFSNRSRLQSVYGEKVSALLESEMEQFAQAVRGRAGWGARVFFADDPACTLPIGSKPARPDDPWELKLALADLDDALAQRGERIGALLIVGGPEIVPFHCLPNPVDDQDTEVASDNPYATRDQNFFIPEWPVGRLPGGAGNDARMLLDTLRRFQIAHAAHQRQLPVMRRLMGWLDTLVAWARAGGRGSFGYTAAIWQNVAANVFRPIGKSGWLHISPPAGVNSRKPAARAGARGVNGAPKPVGRLGYFNLHGLVDAPEWFGHRDLLTPGEDEVDYPVAFRPQDVLSGARQSDLPKVIFSEACYGMHIQNRALDEAIALKFLEAGSLAVAGSTCMAYGSFGAADDSLVAADLLGQSFWRLLKEGMPAGEALRQAKIYLASEMHHRQGYLDGMDQKTLISFVLYGDPLADPLRKGGVPKSIRYRVNPVSEIHTICERDDAPGATGLVPVEMMDAVRQAVAKYLPGMSDARMYYVCEHEGCNSQAQKGRAGLLKDATGQKNSANAQESLERTARPDGKGTPMTRVFHSLVTLSKQVRRSGETHPEIARLTIDEQGNLVKLVVSR